MGLMNTLGLIESGIDMESVIAMHLRGNHYPPVPLSMVQPCIEAIDAYWENNLDLQIELPEGVEWRGNNSAPAHAIIESHHLWPWCEETIDEEYEE